MADVAPSQAGANLGVEVMHVAPHRRGHVAAPTRELLVNGAVQRAERVLPVTHETSWKALEAFVVTEHEHGTVHDDATHPRTDLGGIDYDGDATRALHLRRL